MPNPPNRNDNGGRDRGDREPSERERDRPDRDRGAWDDRARYLAMAPGQRSEPDEDRWMERDSAAGRIGRGDEERSRAGGGYGPQRGYGGGQSGYAAGYSGELPHARGEVPKGEGFAHRTGRDGERAGSGSSGGYGGGGNTGYDDGNMGYGSLGSGADTSHGGTMGYGSSMGERGPERGQDRGQDRGRDRERAMSGWSPGQAQHDGGERGSHRGKGPAGYTRSDERIREDVCDALTEDHHIDASGIEIAVKGGEVTLTGFVPDRRTKRMAEDRIEAMSGVKEVCNNLKVQTDPGNAARPADQGKPPASRS